MGIDTTEVEQEDLFSAISESMYKKAISSHGFRQVLLVWERGICTCYSVTDNGTFFTVPDLDGRYQRYSKLLDYKSMSESLNSNK